MKEHAKKALKHDVEVLGKTVPTIAVVALFLIGSGSAAVLTNFGTVTGEADVTQSIQIDESMEGSLTEGTADLNFLGESDPTVTAGETEVDTFTVENNMDSSYSLEFTSYPGESSVPSGTDSADSAEGAQFKWAEDGIRTTYANYFADAGHDFSTVDTTRSDADVVVVSSNPDNSNDEYGSIETAMNNLQSGEDTVYVESDYTTSDRVEPLDGVKLVSTGAELKAGVYINSVDVTVEGFTVSTEDGSTDNGIALTPSSTGVELRNNDIQAVSSAIYVSSTDALVENNTLTSDNSAIGGVNSQDAEIRYNVIQNSAEGVGVASEQGSPTIKFNRFEGNTVDIKNYDDAVDYTVPTVVADDNFFASGTWSETGGSNFEGDVNPSYELIDSVPSNSEVEVAAVNEFSVMLNGNEGPYGLSTTIS
jgi:hypothetical protein